MEITQADYDAVVSKLAQYDSRLNALELASTDINSRVNIAYAEILNSINGLRTLVTVLANRLDNTALTPAQQDIFNNVNSLLHKATSLVK